MKKVTILCMQHLQEQAVSDLRDLGLLHVTPIAVEEDSAHKKMEHEFHQAQQELQKTKTALNALSEDAEALPRGSATEPAHKMRDHIHSILGRKEKLTNTVRQLRADIERVEPFGDFNPEQVQMLQKQGVAVALRRALVKDVLECPNKIHLHVLSRDGVYQYFACIGLASDLEAANLPGEGVQTPQLPLSELRELLNLRQEEIDQLDADLRRVSQWRDELREWLEEQEEYARFLEVRAAMGHRENLAYIEGFCPAPREEKLLQAARENGWAVALKNPDPDDENVPTLMQYPGWVRPIKAVFDFLQILPGYREADISIVFLLFFSVFFAMLIGDAGYGLLFLGATIFAHWKLPKAPKYPFHLMYVLSIGTVIWGALTGNYFGITDLPAPLAGLTIDWLGDMYNVMGLCFLIGAIHLSIAHFWNTLAMAPSPQALEQVGWLGMVWVMYFTARSMVLGEAFPTLVFYVLGASLLLIVLFMTPVKRLKKDLILHFMLPLNVVSCFVDLVSYVRLFAVSVASLSVASSFNDMAMNAGFNSVIAGFGAVLILVLGHTLNIVLCALGILVHGVRLNTLEFSLHKQLRWAGYPYQPFTKAKTNDAP